MIPLSEVRLARRKLEMTIAAGFGLLQLTRKGKDVTGKDVLTTGAITGLTIGAILAQDKVLQLLVKRGWLAGITGTLIAVEAAYIGGAVISTAIDPEEGFQNYNYAIGVYTDPEVNVQTKLEIVVSNINTILGFYGGGDLKEKEGAFEYYS